MKLSKIVDAVNAKSFGETNWTYDDIYPYFQEAISEINGDLESFRNIPNAPSISESDSFYSLSGYTALSDTHILNYIVTYIVVAMDNAQLAVTSRTQTYASQLAKYKQQLISDLYKWMPITSNSNIYFDLENGKQSNRLPNIGRAWYSEDEGGVLSCNISNSGLYNTLPVAGVHADNPYGFLIPVDKDQRILKGEHLYDYYFIPYESFRPYYNTVIVKINIKGWDIPYTPVPTDVHDVVDIGYKTTSNTIITSRDILFKTIWGFMKGENGKAIDTVAKAYVGSYVENYSSGSSAPYRLKTYLFTHNDDKLNAICGYDQVTFSVYVTNDLVEASNTLQYANINVTSSLTINGLPVPTKQHCDNTFVPKTTTVNGHALSGDVTVTKADVGLGNVVNTGDSATPIENGTDKFTTGGAYTELGKKADRNNTSQTIVANILKANGLKSLDEKGILEFIDSVNKKGVELGYKSTENNFNGIASYENSTHKTCMLGIDNLGMLGIVYNKSTHQFSFVISSDGVNTEEIATKNYSYSKTEVNNKFALITTANNLQSQIDGINAGQNLADIVADLTALNNLDTSKLESGDKVEVLNDSDHDNVSTVYNWNGSVWQYIGAYGTDSYTKAQTNALLEDKADKSTTYTKTETDVLLGAKQNTIDSTHMLSSDLVNSGTHKNKFVRYVDLDFRTSYTISDAKYQEIFNAMLSGDDLILRIAEKDATNNEWTEYFNLIKTEILENATDVYSTRTTFCGSVNWMNIDRTINYVQETTTYNKFFAERNIAGLNFEYSGRIGVDYNYVQNKLTFDDTPTTSSDNPVKSSGIKSYSDNNLQQAKSYTDSKIEDLKWELGTYDLSVESDTTTAYQKSVPSGAIGCHINSIGGMSWKGSINLIEEIIPNSNINSLGVIISDENYYLAVIPVNANTIYTFASTAAQLVMGYFSEKPIIGSTTSDNTRYVENSVTSFTSLYTGYAVVRYNNSSTNPVITDNVIRDSAVTSVVSKDSNNTTLDTLTIPAQVQALEGYGRGINDTYKNVLDFVDKTFTCLDTVLNLKNISKSDIGAVQSGSEDYPYRYNVTSVIGNSIYTSGTIVENNTIIVNTNNEISLTFHGSQQYLIIYSKTKANKDDLYDYLQANDILIQFLLPSEQIVVTDISQYISDSTIQIEAGGTLTFTNIYNQAVPSDIDYLIEEVKA